MNAIAELLELLAHPAQAETTTLSIHRLVQAVLIDEMNKDTQQQWAERVVRVTQRTLPFRNS